MAKAGNKGSSDGNTSKQSVGVKTSSLPGGFKDMVSYPQDNASNVTLKNTQGGSLGGGDTDLSHSLTGTSAVQR